jgi:hypothetical protein
LLKILTVFLLLPHSRCGNIGTARQSIRTVIIDDSV